MVPVGPLGWGWDDHTLHPTSGSLEVARSHGGVPFKRSGCMGSRVCPSPAAGRGHREVKLWGKWYRNRTEVSGGASLPPHLHRAIFHPSMGSRCQGCQQPPCPPLLLHHRTWEAPPLPEPRHPGLPAGVLSCRSMSYKKHLPGSLAPSIGTWQHPQLLPLSPDPGHFPGFRACPAHACTALGWGAGEHI